MKKLLTILLLALCVSVLCGCSDSPEIKPGQTWIGSTDDPFDEDLYIKVVYVRNGYVQYRFAEEELNDPKYYQSISEYNFKRVFDIVHEIVITGKFPEQNIIDSSTVDGSKHLGLVDMNDLERDDVLYNTFKGILDDGRRALWYSDLEVIYREGGK